MGGIRENVVKDTVNMLRHAQPGLFLFDDNGPHDCRGGNAMLRKAFACRATSLPHAQRVTAEYGNRQLA